MFIQSSSAIKLDVAEEIEAIRLMRDKITKRCSGYGFITFKDKNSIPIAMRLNGQVLLGRCMKIRLANPRKKSSPTGSGGINLTSTLKEYDGDGGGAHRNTGDRSRPPAQLHFSYLTQQVHHLVTEETIRGIFSQFGDVIDVMIKKNVCLDGFGQSGYGFVYFPLNPSGLEAAIRAASAITQVMIDGVLYDSYVTRSLEASLQTAGLLVHGESTLSPPSKPNELPINDERTLFSTYYPNSHDSGRKHYLPGAAATANTSILKEKTAIFHSIPQVAAFSPTLPIFSNVSLNDVSLPIRYENFKKVSSIDHPFSFI